MCFTPTNEVRAWCVQDRSVENQLSSLLHAGISERGLCHREPGEGWGDRDLLLLW